MAEFPEEVWLVTTLGSQDPYHVDKNANALITSAIDDRLRWVAFFDVAERNILMRVDHIVDIRTSTPVTRALCTKYSNYLKSLEEPDFS